MLMAAATFTLTRHRLGMGIFFTFGRFLAPCPVRRFGPKGICRFSSNFEMVRFLNLTERDSFQVQSGGRQGVIRYGWEQ